MRIISDFRDYYDGVQQFNFNEKGVKGFEEFAKTFPLTNQNFVDIDAPVFALIGNDFIINPNLRDFEFMKHVNHYTAYQEIDMFLGNNLSKQEVKGNTGDDRVIRDSKGFDDRSFKSDAPGAKKAQRKKNKERKRKNKESK